MTIASQRCAVLGQPIAHSLSPVLHNAAYRALGFEQWRYDKREVGEEGLDAFLKSLDPTWAGLSLTMPLKKTIQPYGVPSNRWAKELEVANTAVFDWTKAAADADGSWPHGKPEIKLYNTDVIGIVLAFGHALGHAFGQSQSEGSSNTIGGSQALVIGNGNTAASAVAACTMMPGIEHIVVAARHPGKNPSLRQVAGKFIDAPEPLREIVLDDAQTLCHELEESSIVINTIPGHAADHVAAVLADALASNAQAGALCGALLDVVYDPRPTKLMQVWRDGGGTALGGEEMLLYQALVQVLLMTGIWTTDRLSERDDPLLAVEDTDILEHAMRTALEEALR